MFYKVKGFQYFLKNLFGLAYMNGKIMGYYEVCKIIFGSEPTNTEVYHYLLKNWSNLFFSSPVFGSIIDAHSKNPKRMQREAEKII